MNVHQCFAYHKLNALWAFCMEIAGRVDILVKEGDHITAAPLRAKVSDGLLILNVSGSAVKNLNISINSISGDCRVNGQACSFNIPLNKIVGVRDPVDAIIHSLHMDVTAQGAGWRISALTETDSLGLPVDTLGTPVPEHVHSTGESNKVTSITEKKGRPGLSIVKK